MQHLTGSELYFHELASTLAEEHDVVVATHLISEWHRAKAKENNYQILHFSELNNLDFDLALISHANITLPYIDKAIFNIKIINIIHSEVVAEEEPFQYDAAIYKYIAIRPTIANKLTKQGINEHKIQMVSNPIDINRFNTQNCSEQNYGLYVGSFCPLREKSLMHFAAHCKYNNLKSLYISSENTQLPYFDECISFVENIEQYFKNCSISGGIINGRTYFEARLCGKKTIEYHVNVNGKVYNIQYEDAPDNIEIENLLLDFDKYNVARKIIS